MSVVVRLGDYRNKGTLTILRELLGKAVRGEVSGFAFSVAFKDGSHKTGFTGKYQADPAEALEVTDDMSRRLRDLQDSRPADLRAMTP
jgi:hypothetical protein